MKTCNICKNKFEVVSEMDANNNICATCREPLLNDFFTELAHIEQHPPVPEPEPDVDVEAVSNDKPYYEGFFAAQLTVGGVIVTPITDEQYGTLENAVAEVNIPLNLDDAGYCMIAMLIDLPNDYPAVLEAIVLQAIVGDVVRQNSDHFKLVG
jgi:hypothetical protein